MSYTAHLQALSSLIWGETVLVVSGLLLVIVASFSVLGAIARFIRRQS